MADKQKLSDSTLEPSSKPDGEILQSIKNALQSTQRGIKSLYQWGDSNSHFILPFLNGLLGDHIEKIDKNLSLNMAFRLNGQDIDIKDLQITDTLKKNGGNLVVFVHGLMGDELVWQDFPKGQKGLGVALQEETDFYPLYIRYNTGKHISDNGKELSQLLQSLCDHFAPYVKNLILIGHSMGGLVIRSAGHYARENNQNWIKKIRKIFLIGSPHSGAILERVSHLSSFVLKNIFNLHTQIISRIIDLRSDGIKDLRIGLLVEEDWKDKEEDYPWLLKKTTVPPLEDVQYYLIIGTLSEDEMSPIAVYFGDGFVSKKSAMGETLLAPKDPIQSIGVFRVFPKTSHNDLLGSEEVYSYIKQQLILD